MSSPNGRNASGGILLRCETYDGIIKHRHVPDLEHKTLCRAFGLNEHITWFDVPKSFHGGSGRRGKVEGTIHQGPLGSRPIGAITVCEEGERFDEDPFHEAKRFGWGEPAPR
jgi:hypothetical protein